MAVAELGFKIQVDTVTKATEKLDKLTVSAGEAENKADKLTKTTGEMSTSLTGAEKSTTRLASAMGGAVGKMIAFAAAAVSIGAITRTLADFEGSMSKLGAITRATSDDLSAMRDVAKDLGATTEFSATQAADGLTFLGMAGFTAAESMAAIPAVLDLATASGMGLADAADTASNIMSGFGIAAENAADVADVLAAASSRANTDVSQLGQAMSTVAPISKALDISLADTAAAIGVVSDAGIQGERAGTALRGVFASLAGPTKAATDTLAKYGLAAKDVDPQVHGLATVLETLRSRGIGTADAMTIFGREAASAALVLIEGSERVGQFGEELTNVNGEADRMAGAMRDNLGGSIKGLMSATEGLIIALGDAGLTAAIRAVVDILTGAIRAVTSMVEAMGQYQGQLIAAAAAATAYFIPTLVAAIPLLFAAVAKTYAWVAALVTLRGAMIATGLGAFIVLAGTMINKFLELVERTGGWGSALSLLGEVADGVWEGIKVSAKGIPPALHSVWQTVKSDFLSLMSVLSENWSRFLSRLSVKVEGIPGLGAASDGLANAAGDAFEAMGKFDMQAQDAARSAETLAEKAAGVFTDGFNKAAEAAGRLASKVEEVGQAASDVNDAPPALPGGDFIGGGGGGSGGGAGGSKGGGGAVDPAIARINALIESLKTEQEVIAEWHAQAQMDLILASDAELAILGGRNEAKLRLEQEYQEKLKTIRSGYNGDTLEQFSTFMGGMAQAMQGGNEKMMRIATAFASVESLINAYRAYNQVIADPSLPWFAKIPAAATVLAAGMKTVSAIRGIGGGGSGAGGGGGAGVGASGVPAQQEQPPRQTRAIIQATGGRTRFTTEEINDIIAGIQKESKDGVIIEGFVT